MENKDSNDLSVERNDPANATTRDLSGNPVNLNEIYTKLQMIENKLSDKWTIAIIVAVITGLFSILTVVVQLAIQKDFESDLKEQGQLGIMNATERVNFYQNAMELTEKIDTGFERICLFSNPSANNITAIEKTNTKPANNTDALTDALEKFRILLAVNSLSLDEQTLKKLESYPEFVAERQYELQDKKVAEADCKDLLENSRELKKEMIETLKTIRQKVSK